MDKVYVSKIGKLWVVQNDLIQLSLDSERCWFDVLEKKSGVTWGHDPWVDTVGELVLERKGDGARLTVNLSDAEEKTISKIKNGLKVQLSKFKVNCESVDGSLTFQLVLPGGSEPEIKVEITDFQLKDEKYSLNRIHLPSRSFYLRTAGDKGYLVIPIGMGSILPVGQATQTPNQVIPAGSHALHTAPFTAEAPCSCGGLYMSWFGAVKGKSSYTAIVETPDDASVLFIGNNNTFEMYRGLELPKIVPQVRIASASPIWLCSWKKLAYARVIRYWFETGGNYVKMAKRFRKYAMEKGMYKSFREKVKDNPNVEKLLGAPLVEFLILTNVAENREFHPRLIGYKKLWYTFSDIQKIIQDMHDNLGIEKAMIILLGFGREGCDHGYPDTWPPNQEAGGLEDLRKLTEIATKLGYLIGLHDCYTFTNEGAPSFSKDILLEGGKYYPWDGGRCHPVCPRARFGFVKRNFSTYKRELPLLTAHFTDVLSGESLTECHDPSHSTTRSEDKQMKIETFRYITEDMGLIIGSEDSIDYLAPYCHYFMSASTHAKRNIGNASPIMTPLWNLVYHDAVNSFWYEGDGYNRPGFYAHYVFEEKFLVDLLCGNPSHWNFYCADYQYWREVLKEVHQVLDRLNERLAYEEMVDHEFLTDDYFVQRSKFSGGTEIYVNFRDRDYREDGLEVPARGFYVKNSPIGTFSGWLKPTSVAIGSEK